MSCGIFGVRQEALVEDSNRATKLETSSREAESSDLTDYVDELASKVGERTQLGLKRRIRPSKRVTMELGEEFRVRRGERMEAALGRWMD